MTKKAGELAMHHKSLATTKGESRCLTASNGQLIAAVRSW